MRPKINVRPRTPTMLTDPIYMIFERKAFEQSYTTFPLSSSAFDGISQELWRNTIFDTEKGSHIVHVHGAKGNQLYRVLSNTIRWVNILTALRKRWLALTGWHFIIELRDIWHNEHVINDAQFGTNILSLLISRSLDFVLCKRKPAISIAVYII